MIKRLERPLYTGSEWTLDKIEAVTDAIESIASDELALDTFPYRLEIISSEQMMDAYTSAGIPINYHHWSYGKHFISLQEEYRRGRMGLAYEIVINSNPCIAYLMEENTMTMQTLVVAHAAFGHNAFMKNNYLFKQWTQPETVLDYFAFARNFIAECEERYGIPEVEGVLDACHALQLHGVHRYKHPTELTPADEERRDRERAAHRERELNVLWSTLPRSAISKVDEKSPVFPQEPEENILYFIEKHAPELPEWKRQIIQIVRRIAQYFYPQRQTKLLNEGFATFTHYVLLNRMSDLGMMTAGATTEYLHSHTNVVAQPSFTTINPYALGFELFRDIKRICEDPTVEDRDWFPDIAGGPWLDTVKFVAESFKDESAVLQFLSPKVIRDFRLFSLLDDESRSELEVSAIHNEDGYRHIRRRLAKQYDVGLELPDIQVFQVGRDRKLMLRHNVIDGRSLHEADAAKVVAHTQRLWGFQVGVETVVTRAAAENQAVLVR